MPRTKHGRAAAQASTRQALEAELSEACGAAKNAKTDDDYKEAHSWINDVLTELDKHPQR
jgi:transposase-like protein